jgi:hypothetical protein
MGRRELHHELRTRFGTAGSIEPPSVQFHDLFHNCQSQSKPTLRMRSIRLVEGLEHVP